MLSKITLNKYVKDSINQGNVTENLQKSVDKLYKQINELKSQIKKMEDIFLIYKMISL